ncbi:hypothetical protein L1987_38200 [Smallanthus sonchifolius]|uniref:Uncharacterized protein n=1 Tax=Smallanthus sonchifolius TaxID=185202 RepID=A0ACB9HKA8_9ASTR|nr:hypothetical protein L1987_38200 [Smallanthus sonchifolius]
MPVRMFIDKDSNILAFPYHSARYLRSVLSFRCFRSLSGDIEKYLPSFVLLRVLDLQKCPSLGFSEVMELLVHLRYLAIWIPSGEFPSSICNLWNLQTLIYITMNKSIVLPTNMSDFVNLRHLWIPSMRFFFLPSIKKPMNLQTLSNVELGEGVHNFQKCFPYIKELTCITYLDEENNFKSLTYLEKLSLNGCVKKHITFPTTLKTLTLRNCGLPWSEMSIIQSLPNLHVLKPKENAFKGSCWNTYEQEFQQLKFLRLESLNINLWEAYNTSFTCLRQLEIIHCHYLDEIPLEIGEIPTLELIIIEDCKYSVGESVRKIQEEQLDEGNYDLKIDHVD